jgi:predicted porin
MNKKLMALAVAGALTAPGLALAQTSLTPQAIVPSPGVASSNGITLYGRLDETIISNKFSSNGTGTIGGVTKQDVYSPGNAMGIRGREDLGGGSAAWFQLEIGVWPSERLDTSAVTGNNWGGRNSAIGFSSGIGDVLVGNWDTPYKVAFGSWNSVTSGGFSSAGIIMGNGDTTGALNNALCQSTVSNTSGSIAITAPATNTCVTEVTANGTAFSRRINNSVQWWSPIWSGVQVKLMTAMNTYKSPSTTALVSGNQNAQEYSASVGWAQGPFTVLLAYDNHKGLRPANNAAGSANPKDDAMQLGAKWNFGPGEVGVGYEKLKYGDNGAVAGANQGGMDVDSFAVNGRFNVGPGALWANYSKNSGGKSCSFVGGNNVIGSAACGVEAKMMGFGYDYVLSKRTKLYIAYNKIDNGFDAGKGIGTNYYYIAGPAGNNGTSPGTAGGVQAGTDVTSYGLGLQHVF